MKQVSSFVKFVGYALMKKVLQLGFWFRVHHWNKTSFSLTTIIKLTTSIYLKSRNLQQGRFSNKVQSYFIRLNCCDYLGRQSLTFNGCVKKLWKVQTLSTEALNDSSISACSYFELKILDIKIYWVGTHLYMQNYSIYLSQILLFSRNKTRWNTAFRNQLIFYKLVSWTADNCE